MAEIRPFRGLLYNGEKIKGDYGSVMAPPYDVISDELRDQLYEKSEYNIIKLILGKTRETNGTKENCYTRAKKLFQRWQEEDVLKKDETDSIYIYVQEYVYKDKKCRRIGFMSLMKIDDSVLPHEYTLSKPKKDRMSLIKEIKGNLSPIFSLYDDKNGKIKETLKESISFSDPIIDIESDGQRHMLWRFSDQEKIKTIIDEMSGDNTFIADGHHRYEVGRMYRDEISKEEGYNGNADHIMMYFTDLSDNDNLTVVGTHRVIKEMPKTDSKEMIEKFEEFFELTECDNLNNLTNMLEDELDTPHCYGFLLKGQYFFLRPKDSKRLKGLIIEDKSDKWKELDVSILHSSVFDKVLSIDGSEGNIVYVKTPDSAESLVEGGECDAAFLLNPTRVKQLKAVAELGEMMPQKSTYFFPKLLSGLVMNKFEE
ncbi:MAG: DUF1015 domain-containing protein [Candidatus Omnitrophica bacterium]|nr:DUF1015 domain-containing protein [Candidatus Omnitrophota bacterium]